jgi:site-specific DNA recombinase
MSLVGGTSYGCSTARNKGTCANRRTIKRRELEAMVLDGLRAKLMDPEAVKAFVAEFHREINRLTAEKRSQAEGKRREVEKVEREIQALVEAVKRGAFSAALQRELTTLEARHVDLTREAAALPHRPSSFIRMPRRSIAGKWRSSPPPWRARTFAIRPPRRCVS